MRSQRIGRRFDPDQLHQLNQGFVLLAQTLFILVGKLANSFANSDKLLPQNMTGLNLFR
jgi:hypothetical protein